MSRREVLLLPGDGIGPEVIAQAQAVLAVLAPHLDGLHVSESDFGGVAYDKHQDPLPDETLAQVLAANATLLGAVGGPAYDAVPIDKRPEAGLLRLRKEMGVYANLRPITIHEQLLDSSSLRPEIIQGLDLIIVRELIGGLYFATPRGINGNGEQREGYNTMRYSVAEIRRIAIVAFQLAKLRRGKICSVDKANVLETSRLWREIVTDVAGAYPDVELEHMYVDNCAMQLVRAPNRFDVLLTCNIFGDILSDLASELAGSIGMLPSASLGDKLALYEPIHGSAPDIAGTDKANPCAAILSVAMLLENSLDAKELAAKVRTAVRLTLANGVRTVDLCRTSETAATCTQMGAAICQYLAAQL